MQGDTTQDKLIDVQRGGGEMKGTLTRPLKNRKVRWLYNNWWSGEAVVEEVSHRNLNYRLHKVHLLTLLPKLYVEDGIVNGYFELLRERETMYTNNGQFKKVAKYFFMPSDFMETAKMYVQSKHPLERPMNELEVQNFSLHLNLEICFLNMYF